MKAIIIDPNNALITQAQYNPEDIDDPHSYRARDGFIGVEMWPGQDNRVYLQGHVVISNDWGNVSTNGETTTTTDDTTEKGGGDDAEPCHIPGCFETCCNTEGPKRGIGTGNWQRDSGVLKDYLITLAQIGHAKDKEILGKIGTLLLGIIIGGKWIGSLIGFAAGEGLGELKTEKTVRELEDHRIELEVIDPWLKNRDGISKLIEDCEKKCGGSSGSGGWTGATFDTAPSCDYGSYS